ncbi:hypothetical protein [Streptomyces sp. NBC_01304]|uniref:hypothetical protein n=1 Tax=Streptomyces sp. NBC_01304 TaxID=2903818 RepID=UPI002E14613D|nr:hypothetical protein OG430_48995 [Streptomyces sp. NBC_01304]
MRMHTDDELYAVDSVFLGPPRLTFLWRARYQAYVVGAALTGIMLIGLQMFGLMGFWPIVYGLFLIILATRKLTPYITHETTIRSVIRSFVNDVRAPRSARSHQQGMVAEMSTQDIKRTNYL